MKGVVLVGLAACHFRGHELEALPGDAGADAAIDAPADADTLSDGLIAWYQFEMPPPGVDSASDHHTPSCGPNDPTVCPTSFPTGKVGAAYQFDGIKTWLDVPLGGTLQPAQLTAALFLRFAGFPQAGNTSDGKSYACPIGKVLNATMPNDNSWQLCLHTMATNKYQWLFISEHVPPGSAPKPDQLFTTAAIAMDEWHHVAITFDGAAKHIYLDGAESTDMTTPNKPLVYDMSSLTMGSDILGVGTIDVPFHGELDDVRIYDRVLTDAEIAALSHQ